MSDADTAAGEHQEPQKGPESRPTPPPVRNKPAIPNGVLGMIIFILTEIMFFAGLISAFMIVKAGTDGGIWPPLGQPRLPAEETAFNTAALLVSGALLWWASRCFNQEPGKAKTPMLFSILFGVFFVGFQGVEWTAMLGQGLTMTSSTHGSFFYLIVGCHSLHAVVAICFLVGQYLMLLRGTLTRNALSTATVFWYFVVLLWPFLYFKVYL
jgi:heme/copper-type cytochrome/quinol oxidase subunit 3